MLQRQKTTIHLLSNSMLQRQNPTIHHLLSNSLLQRQETAIPASTI